ncbi:MAG: excinuclease ABC subunit C [Chloroflexi bacterium RBG_16_64_32]|nr:MAG: excinuclease ABC subunit C [Chloroflexi bacterium RBG_16_64_32]
MAAASRTQLIEQVRAMPTRPGVYIFREASGEVIYVGKAASLKSRVRSYFGSPRSLEPKTRRLAGRIADVEYVVTASPQEALILEASLVKRHQPYFNVRLKDDKHYPYLKIDLSDKWPRVEITRRVQDDGARYFGPYASAGSVRQTLDLVKKLFPWRSCTKTITGNDPRPCLDYYIHRCIGPCASLCSQEEYRDVIRQVTMFLEGRSEEVAGSLRRSMQEASAALEYERAARLRDQVRAIEHTRERQVMALPERVDMDVFGMARDGPEACVQVFFVRRGNVVGRDNFALDGAADEPDADVLASFLKQFYQSAAFVPRRVLLPFPVTDQALIRDWLAERRGKGVQVLAPQRGDKRALVQTVVNNALESLQAARARWLADTGKARRALEQLQEEMNLPSLPQRIECYDISNIQGAAAVGSMVVFVDGRARPAEYRRFRIKSVEGANDFAMLQEVLRRRFQKTAEALAARGADSSLPPAAGDLKVAPTTASAAASPARGEPVEPRAPGIPEFDESFAAVPDLVIVDGGKGQVSAAHDEMRNLGVGQIPLAGLAKRFEELYVKDVSEPILLPRTSQALYLVQRIRDEAHRFAITYHRKVRAKAGMRSALDAVPGVGPKRKKALLRKFGSVKAIREAGVEEIAATPGFTRSLAEKVLAGL